MEGIEINIETLRADILSARKAKDATKVAFLSALLSDIVKRGKDDGNREPNPEDFSLTIRKFLKGITQGIDDCLKMGRDYSKLKNERDILMDYLPKQLELDSLKGEIFKILVEIGDQSPKAMGAVMKLLKERFDGQYDNKIASTLIKSMLK